MVNCAQFENIIGFGVPIFVINESIMGRYLWLIQILEGSSLMIILAEVGLVKTFAIDSCTQCIGYVPKAPWGLLWRLASCCQTNWLPPRVLWAILWLHHLSSFYSRHSTLTCRDLASWNLLWAELKVKVFTQSRPTLCDPMDCRPPGSSVHGTLQARILEWVAISFSRGSSRARDQTRLSRTADRLFTHWVTRETIMSWIVSPSKFVCWSHNLQNFRMWLYLERAFLKR